MIGVIGAAHPFLLGIGVVHRKDIGVQGDMPCIQGGDRHLAVFEHRYRAVLDDRQKRLRIFVQPLPQPLRRRDRNYPKRLLEIDIIAHGCDCFKISLAKAGQADHAADNVGMGFLVLALGPAPGDLLRQLAVAVEKQADQG